MYVIALDHGVSWSTPMIGKGLSLSTSWGWMADGMQRG